MRHQKVSQQKCDTKFRPTYSHVQRLPSPTENEVDPTALGIRLEAEFAGVDLDLHDDDPLGEHSETDENFEIHEIEKGNVGEDGYI